MRRNDVAVLGEVPDASFVGYLFAEDEPEQRGLAAAVATAAPPRSSEVSETVTSSNRVRVP